MKIAGSHVWQSLKRGPMKDRPCLYCNQIIKKGSKNIRKYDLAYTSTKYAHEKCLEKAREKNE